uniref:Phospholipase-like protein n=1 Tax=Tanacetum cinerariifolium TaxID=118510 RepID=A0A6L2K5A8_TANCI|nr:phospholipase-like protein [Tanacetum cinerariifolium]
MSQTQSSSPLLTATQLVPVNRQDPIGKANMRLNLDKLPCPAEYKIIGEILKRHEAFKLKLDQTKVELSVNDLRIVLDLPQATDSNQERLVQLPEFLSIIKFLDIIGHEDTLLTEEIKQTDAYKKTLSVPWSPKPKRISKKKGEQVSRESKVDKFVEGDEQVNKLIEGDERFTDSLILSQEDFGIRLEPESHKESLKEEKEDDDCDYVDIALIRKRRACSLDIREENEQIPLHLRGVVARVTKRENKMIKTMKKNFVHRSEVHNLCTKIEDTFDNEVFHLLKTQLVALSKLTFNALSRLIFNALSKRKCTKKQVLKMSFAPRHTILSKQDHDDHLDGPPKGEKNAKKQKTTRGIKSTKGHLHQNRMYKNLRHCHQYNNRILMGGLRDQNEPPRFFMEQGFIFLKNGNTKSKSYDLSLHKIHATPFSEDDLEELLTRWVGKVLKRKNHQKIRLDPEEVYTNLKIIKVIRVKNEETHGQDFMDEIVVKQADGRAYIFSESDYNHQKVNIFYNGLSTMNRQLLDSQGPIPGMTPAQAPTAIQTMADHSQKWHDSSSSRSINNNNSNTKGITAIVSKLDSLDLGASINVIPKSMFEHLKLARLEKTDMLVEMVELTKRTPIGIVENTTPCNYPCRVDVFNKEISLGIGDDRVTFDMNKKVNNFITPVGTIYMINDEPSSSNDTPIDESSRVEKSDDLMQMHDSKKTRILEPNTHIPSAHFCKPIKQMCNRTLRFWPTCNPTMKACNRGVKIYGMNEEVVLKFWYCYLDGDRKSIKDSGLSFPELLLVSYRETQGNDLIWYKRYVEWCNENSIPNMPTSKFTSIQEDYKPRPKDHPFKDWLLTKVGHTDVSKPVERALLKTWLIDCFQELVKDPRSRSFDDYKWMFELEIDQSADEYELGIGKKGHMLDDIWENCKKLQGDNTYWWYDQESEEEERREMETNIEGYDPPRVHVETFKIKRYSFDSGQSFMRVTKELMDALPLRRENGSRFREMIRKEVDSSLSKELEFGVSSTHCHVGNKVAQLTVCKNSVLIRSGEQHSGESFV